MPRISLLAILLCLPVLSAADGHEDTGLRAVTHEDVWTMKRLGTPVPSPDGDWAIVQVTEPSYEEDGTVSDLWLVAVDGDTEPRRLTASDEAESGVAWSPDGTRIAFSTTRGEEEVSQIYVMNMTMPGEAQRVTSLATGASGPKWSPDSERLAFESRVYPGAMTDEENAEEKTAREERDYNVSIYEIFPIRQWNRWRDDLETHVFVQDAVPGAEAVDLMAGTDFVAQPGYAGVPSLGGESLMPEWTPDGEALVISATTNLDDGAHSEVLYHLYRIAASGGEPEPLTGGGEWSCHTATFSADGRALYCLFDPVTEYVYNLTEIARFDWPDSGAATDFTAEPNLLTEGFDRSVSDMTVSRDSRRVFFTAADEGRVRLFSVAANGRGGVSALNRDSGGVYAGPEAAGNTLVARWEDATRPAEVVRINTRNGTHEQLTAFNTEHAASLDRRPFLEFWFESDLGRRVHSYVALPPGFDENEKYPVVTLIHGGPHASSLDADHVRWSPHLLASGGYVVVMTDYTGSVGYGVDFARAIQGDPLKTPGDEIEAALDEAIRLYPFIDADAQAAAGASYGGHLVNWLLGTTDRFQTLVSHAGLIDLEGQWSSSDVIRHREINAGSPPWGDSPIWDEQSPSSYAANFSTPILLTIGELDYRVPLNQTIAAWSYVQRQQVPARLLVFHEADHWIMKGSEARIYWEEVHAWLAQYLGD
ncbi:MAG: S9 family peptidase [Woeseiaceae bacterium]|nr:S9 family peptidase [Woeseiaceae bacterium]